MKHLKKITALALAALLLVGLFSGCAEKQAPEEPEEKADLTFYFYDTFMRGSKAGHIEEVARQIVQEELGLLVDIRWISPMEWNNTVQLDISGGEQVDVICLTPGAHVAELSGMGMLMDLSDLLPQYAPEAYAQMGEYLNCYTVDGALYGVPTAKDFTESRYLLFNADILDECRLRKKAVTLSTLDQVETIFEEVTSREENVAWAFGAEEGLWAEGFLTGATEFENHTCYDSLSDPLGLLYCRDGAVSQVTAQEQYVAACTRLAHWKEQGWLWPDSANTVEDHQSLLERGKLFCSAATAESGLEITTATSTDLVAVKLTEGLVTTRDLTQWGVGIASTCENPEAACRFIELLYTNSDLLMTLVRGIKLEDYLDTGANILLTGNYVQDDSIIGNQQLLIPLSGGDPEHYIKVAEKNAAAPRSEALGFALDRSDLTGVLTALMSVQDRYHEGMVCGEYSEESYAEYQAALAEAGIAAYVSAVQAQLDAFLAQ